MSLVRTILMLLLLLNIVSDAAAVGTTPFSARISDVAGRPVAGAKLFVYATTNVRMPADFISPPSDSAGVIRGALPAGTYWAVARFKKDNTFGPLMPGDRHSGEPIEVEIAVDREASLDFVVADIQEISQKKRSASTEVVRVRGRVLQRDGTPVAGVYVFAHRTRDVLLLPEFISAWTDENGGYVIYLPAGARFFLGSARQFPPVGRLTPVRELTTVKGKLDIAMDLELAVK